MNTDTPRTNAAARESQQFVNVSHGFAEFARQLERELNEVRRVCGDRYPDSQLLQSVFQLRAELENVNGDYAALHTCLMNRERTLIQSGEDWVKAKTECDRWHSMAQELCEVLDAILPLSPAVIKFQKMEREK